jgi:hypothetical protein
VDYHRPISTYLNELAVLGCRLCGFAEPGFDLVVAGRFVPPRPGVAGVAGLCAVPGFLGCGGGGAPALVWGRHKKEEGEGVGPFFVWGLPSPLLLFVCVFGGVLLSRALACGVPSALAGLTAGFGMGPGVSPPL